MIFMKVSHALLALCFVALSVDADKQLRGSVVVNHRVLDDVIDGQETSNVTDANITDANNATLAEGDSYFLVSRKDVGVRLRTLGWRSVHHGHEGLVSMLFITGPDISKGLGGRMYLLSPLLSASV